METKHTTAPWTYQETGFEGSGNYIIRGANEQIFVALVESFDTDEASKANARLIASAPELLKMLQHAVELMEELNVGAHDVRIYKSVIQKATNL